MWAGILILLAGGFPLPQRREVVKISDPYLNHFFLPGFENRGEFVPLFLYDSIDVLRRNLSSMKICPIVYIPARAVTLNLTNTMHLCLWVVTKYQKRISSPMLDCIHQLKQKRYTASA